MFQRPYLSQSREPPVYTHLTVQLDVVVITGFTFELKYFYLFYSICVLYQVRQTSTEIVDLAPTLTDLGVQGHTLASAINTYSARNRQSKGLPSKVTLYFQIASNKPKPIYISTIVKCQITVTNVAFGVKVRGDYIHIITQYSKAGWTLASLIGEKRETK